MLWARVGGRTVRSVRAATVGTHAVAHRRAVRDSRRGVVGHRRRARRRPRSRSSAAALPQSSRCRHPFAAATANALAYGDEERFVAAGADAVVARAASRSRSLRRGAGRRDRAAAPRRRSLRRRRARDDSSASRSPRWWCVRCIRSRAGGSCSFPPASRSPIRSRSPNRCSCRASTSRRRGARPSAALGDGRARPPARERSRAGSCSTCPSRWNSDGAAGRGNAEVVEPNRVAVAVVRADAALAQARTRRIQVA